MGDVATGTLVHLLLAVLIIAAASALTTALVVKDDITEPIREAIWRHFPRTGQDAPVMDLDGSSFTESKGTFLGNVIACTCCFGVWSTAAWCAASWAVLGFPGTHTADGIVLSAAQLAAACIVQRAWNART